MAKKKAAIRKKSVAKKKAATRKKTGVKKKAATRKKTGAKKKAATRKSATKKPKKASSRSGAANSSASYCRYPGCTCTQFQGGGFICIKSTCRHGHSWHL